MDAKPTAFTYIKSSFRILHTTLSYFIVGLMPEENHVLKGNAWAEIHAYRRAAWHYRKLLEYGEDSFARASLGWCYERLGMVESAVEHYRLAHAKNKSPGIALNLAETELDLGNTETGQSLIAEVATRRSTLSAEENEYLVSLEDRLSKESSSLTNDTTEASNAV